MYKAFLSYAHEDKEVAKALQTALGRLAKPLLRRRALEVFRDDHMLRADDDLWATIFKALGDSQYLVLLASPEAVASEGVQRELEKWLSLHDGIAVNLLIVLTRGELAWSGNGIDWSRTTALPHILEGRFAAEPKWCDLRTLPIERMTLDDAEFRDELASVAARLHDVPKDELIGEDVRAHRRFRRLVAAAVILIAILAVAGGFAGSTALRRMRIEQARNALRDGVLAIEEASLASGEWNTLTRDGVAAVVRGVRALRDAGDPYPLEANEALRRAARVLPRAQREIDAGARTAVLRYAAKSNALLIVSPENVARVLRVDTLGPPMPFEIDEPLFSDDLSVIGGVLRSGSLLLMRTDTGQRYRALAVERVERAFLSPSGSSVITSTKEASVLRRVETGAIVDVLHMGLLDAAVFSPDEQTIALLPRGGDVVLRDRKRFRSRELFRGGHAASFDARGRYLAVADGTSVYVCDIRNIFDRPEASGPRIGTGSSIPDRLRLSDDGSLVTLRFGGGSRLATFDIRSGDLVREINGRKSTPDLRYAWSHGAGVVEITDIDRGEVAAHVKTDLAPASVAYSAGREVAIAYPARRTIRIFETHPVDEVSVASLPEPVPDPRAWLLHDPRPYWPAGTGDEIAKTIPLPRDWTPPFTLSPGGRYLVAKGGDEPRVWDVRRRTRVARLLPGGAGQEWYAWAFSPDDRYFIVWTGINWNLSGPTSAAVWNLEERRRIALLRLDEVPEAFAIDPARLRFALAGRYNGTHRIHVVDIPTGVLRELASRTFVTALAFDDSGAMASAGVDHVIRVWDLEAEQEVARIRSETRIEHLRFTPRGILVAGDRAWRWSNEALLAAIER